LRRLLKALTGSAVLPILLIAGCATSPEGLLDKGDRFDFDTLRTPYTAAICIARNANEMGGGIAGEERTLGDSSTEVVVRPSRGASDTIAIVQINYIGPHSKASVSVNPSQSDRAAFAKRLMEGC
jgi:hypothetical protein